MHDSHKTGFFSRVGRFCTEQAFYLILFLCVAVIGITAWLFTAAVDSAKLKSDGNVSKRVSVTPGISESVPEEPFHWMPAAEDASEAPDISEPAVPAEEPVTEAADAEAEVGEIETAEVMASAFAWPLRGEVCAAYSVDELQYDRTMADWRTHAGMDIEADPGEKVAAAADGTVERIYTDAMYGVTVILSHGAGLRSVYSNLAGTPAVSVGDAVALGQVIGSVGSTADAENGDVPHLHFAMTLDEVRVNPMDYLPAR